MLCVSYFYRASSYMMRFVLISAKPFREIFLKLSLLILPLIVLASLAHAQTPVPGILQSFQKECETSEVKSMIGENGSCRVIIAPQKLQSPKKGVCIGTFKNVLPCVINYFSTNGVGAIGLTCGTDPENPSIDQEFRAEAVNFSVATLINTAAGNDIVIEDKMNYMSLTSRMVEVFVTESATEAKAKITLKLGSLDSDLSDVTCLKDI